VQCLLGDDYGAVPTPAVIEEDEFRLLHSHLLDSGEGRLLTATQLSERRALIHSLSLSRCHSG